MSIARTALIVSGIVGFSAVALGAFGAHGVKSKLAGKPDAEQRMAWWQTGSQYHLAHAIAIGLCALRPDPVHEGPAVAIWLFLLGIVLFSGSLYTMTITNIRKLGAVTPLGGVAFLAGWIVLAWNSLMIVD
ncbi:MAG: DUF423 domain-containing protein [Polyangiaceae bacterium]